MESGDSRREQDLHSLSTRGLGLTQGKPKNQSNLLLYDTVRMLGETHLLQHQPVEVK